MKRLLEFFRKIKINKKIKKRRSKPQRSKDEFYKKYNNNYYFGINSYGIPAIKHAHKDSTVNIGSYCSIASDVKIHAGGLHRHDWISSYPFPDFFEEANSISDHYQSKGNVEIGNDVWICENVIILSGIKIGDGVVIGAGSIVTKDLLPYGIYAGNPAKLIKYRFNKKTREELSKIAWWEWPEDEVLNIVKILCSNKINQLITYAKNRKNDS